MAGRLASRKKTNQLRTKVKTGCATCRIRKVKCDETKPSCVKCVSTGRTCEGYEDLFRVAVIQPGYNNAAGVVTLGADPQPPPNSTDDVDPRDVDLLNRYFSTKTIFGVELSCAEEAREILRESLVDPSIHYAVSSLKALREHLEGFGSGPETAAQQTLGYEHGIQQYCSALGGLASNLTSLGPHGAKSALLCCQIFVSIEQVRENYTTMAEHITQGLRIMQQFRARPSLDASAQLVPANPDRLPLLDVFLIKLFVAPCKYADGAVLIDDNRTPDSMTSNSPTDISNQIRRHRSIAPDMRTKLVRIATSIHEFLSDWSRVTKTEEAIALKSKRRLLLHSLNEWLRELEVNDTHSHPSVETVTLSFTRYFHQIMKIILLRTSEIISDRDANLHAETDLLQSRARDVGDRVQAWRAQNSRNTSC